MHRQLAWSEGLPPSACMTPIDPVLRVIRPFHIFTVFLRYVSPCRDAWNLIFEKLSKKKTLLRVLLKNAVI